jgi:hypothetical protein
LERQLELGRSRARHPSKKEGDIDPPRRGRARLFQKGRAGYQRRINAVLRFYMQQKRKKRA